MATVTAALDYVRARVPLYTMSEAARIVDMPESTFGTWANGYVRNRPGKPPVKAFPVITRLHGIGHGPSVPFIGLAEAMTLSALRRNEKIPLPQVRAMVDQLERSLGVEHALASNNLYRVGPTFVFDYAQANGELELMDLVEVKGKQALWAETVRQYMSNVAWDDQGWVEKIRIPRYKVARIAVDPYHASGAPYFEDNGVPVSGIVGRARGGDSMRLLADDYDLPIAQIREVLADLLEPAA